MLHRPIVFSLCFAVFTLNACSSSDSGSPAPTDGGSDAAKADVGTDTRVTFDSDLDTAPALCWFVNPASPQVQACDVCSHDKCKAQNEACYGPAYLTGTYSGTCGDYARCECTCTELDDICQENCKVGTTTACQTCMSAIDDCETTTCKAECSPF